MKNAFITGGSGGIGSAVCRKLAADGYALAVGYRSNKSAAEKICSEIRSCGGVALPVHIELTDKASVKAAYELAVSELGVPKVLVNNAGTAHIGMYTDMTEDEICGIINTDLTGAMLLTRYAAADMVKRQEGRIVNISSVWGEVGASCETAYSAAKAGLIGFTKALGKELAPSGITVNCICAGMIDTDMNRIIPEEDRKAIVDDIPAGRMGTPEEIAALVSFLCSGSAGYITAQTVRCDGGWV